MRRITLRPSYMKISCILEPNTTSEKKETRPELYAKTCRKLNVHPVPAVRDALKQGSDVIVPNRSMNALDMLSLTNALVVSCSKAKHVLLI